MYTQVALTLRTMEVLVSAIQLTVAGAQESQLIGPENTLGVLGSNVTLKCASASTGCRGIDWLKQNSSSQTSVFRDGRGIFGAYKDRYSVDNSSGCDLVVGNVKLGDAGRYECRAIISSNTVEKTAYLIVLRTRPSCTVNATMGNTAEGDGVQLTCEVTYDGANRSSMVWKGVDNAPSAVGNGKIRRHSVVASVPEVPAFTCITSFAVETKDRDLRPIIGLAANIPVATCETPSIKVTYSVRNVELSPSFSTYATGSIINCTAKGHPSPTFKWQEIEDGDGGSWVDIPKKSGTEFTTAIASAKQYRCVAMNVVRGQSYNATSQEFLVNNTSIDTSTTPFQFTLMEWIAVGGASGFLLLTVLIVICCCVRTCPGYKCCRSANKPNESKKKLNTRSHEKR